MKLLVIEGGQSGLSIVGISKKLGLIRTPNQD
jgi:hypothetical protein